MLRRARLDASRVEPGYKGNPLGLPTFLLGGAALSSVASGLQAFTSWAVGKTVGVVVFSIVAGVVFIGLAWCARCTRQVSPVDGSACRPSSR